MSGLSDAIPVIEAGIVAYFLAVNTWYALLLALAVGALWSHVRRLRGELRWRLATSAALPRISVVVPAHDEEAVVADTVRAYLTLAYPDHEVIVVNDGSADGTLDVLVREFGLREVPCAYEQAVPSRPLRAMWRARDHPRLVVVDKEAGGSKADAANAGLCVATGALVCVVDADSFLDRDALLRLVGAFLDDERVVAAGATVRVANGSELYRGRVRLARAPRRILSGIQAVAYLRAFLFGRLGWNRVGGNLIVSGAFGLFRRDDLVAVGGYQPETVGEDIELVMRLRRRGYERGVSGRVVFVPDPVAWTEVPDRLDTLAGQRERWHRGLADTLVRHAAVLFRPRYRALGLVVAPYYLVFELLAPVVEALGLVVALAALALGGLHAELAVLFFLVAYGYSIALSAVTLLIEELSYRRYERFSDRAALVAWMLVESLGYRQLTVLWRLRGLVRYLGGRRGWGDMAREGIGR